MHDGICPLESWQTEHRWRHGAAVISGKMGDELSYKLLYLHSFGFVSIIATVNLKSSVSSQILLLPLGFLNYSRNKNVIHIGHMFEEATLFVVLVGSTPPLPPACIKE